MNRSNDNFGTAAQTNYVRSMNEKSTREGPPEPNEKQSHRENKIAESREQEFT